MLRLAPAVRTRLTATADAGAGIGGMRNGNGVTGGDRRSQTPPGAPAMGVRHLRNGITLTPGTVTIEIGGVTIEVHALTDEAARALEDGQTDSLVSAIEGTP